MNTIITLHGWGSTPYVSRLWALWSIFSSANAEHWPLKDSREVYITMMWKDVKGWVHLYDWSWPFVLNLCWSLSVHPINLTQPSLWIDTSTKVTESAPLLFISFRVRHHLKTFYSSVVISTLLILLVDPMGQIGRILDSFFLRAEGNEGFVFDAL